jgi:hypothetical protein
MARDAPGQLIYFDTNIFDPVSGLKGRQEFLVSHALGSQQFRLVFDLDCFLEPLLAFRFANGSGATNAVGQLERMLKWCDRRRTVSLPQSILSQAVRSYSDGSVRIEEFLNGGQLDPEVESELGNWDSERSPSNRVWFSVARDAESERCRFQKSLSDLLQQIGAPQPGCVSDGTIPVFKEF